MIRRFFRRVIAPIDPMLMVVSLLLLGYGLVVLGSAAPGRVVEQAINMAVALVVMLLVAQVPPQRMMQFAPAIFALGILLLIAVALFGDVTMGAKRWLNVGFMRIQPSEIMKIAMPLMLAWYFQKYETQLRLREYIGAAIILVLPIALIARQPDLGTAMLVFAGGCFIIFLAGLSWRVIGFLFVAAVAAAPLGWSMLRGYQKNRILTLLNPEADPLGAGFHIIQSTIAIGSGGIFGKGWGQGTQSQLEFIPERHTDFVFSVLAEELGLIGITVLILLYGLLIVRGLTIAARAPTLFTRLLAAGITLGFFIYGFVNMGMVSGILPVVGVPLPFISYGGTSLVTLFLGIGILMSINRHRMLVRK